MTDDGIARDVVQQIRDGVAAGGTFAEVQYALIVDAAGIDPGDLSAQGQRTLAWLADWDQSTTAGLVELLRAARQAVA